MVTVKDYANEIQPTWCPGCGDYGILNTVKRALVQMELAPHQVFIATGIGCGSKLPDYMKVNSFTTIHGRPIPVAQGVHLANHGMKVIVVAGDGDTYGIGGNHFMHVLRRNSDITIIAQDNAVYGLTKGQYSPTSRPGFITKTSPAPEGSIEQPVNPMALGLATGATFVGRAFAGNVKHLTEMIVKAVEHPGASLLDVFQPCVIFNRNQSYEFYRPRVYDLQEESHDHTDYAAAWEKAHEWGDRIPIGVFYQEEGRPTYEQQVPALKAGPLVEQPLKTLTKKDYDALVAEFL